MSLEEFKKFLEEHPSGNSWELLESGDVEIYAYALEGEWKYATLSVEEVFNDRIIRGHILDTDNNQHSCLDYYVFVDDYDWA